MRLRKLLEAIECGTSVGIIKKKAGLPDIYIYILQSTVRWQE